MVKLRSLFTAMVAGVAAMAGTAQAQTAGNAAYVNAPVMSHIPDAPQHRGHCGIFETCASTKIGLGRGDIMVRLSAVGVLPQDRDSKVWLTPGGPNGRGNSQVLLNGTHLSTTNQAMPELTVEYFITDNVSVDLIATSTRHEVATHGGAVGSPDAVESACALPPTLTFAWPLMPHTRFNP